MPSVLPDERPSASFSTHVKVAFCKSALNASLGLNFRFTFLMLFALTSALVAAPPAEVSEMLKLPQSPSLTLSPASRWRSTTLRSWRKAIIASEGFSVVSSAMSIATWVSSTWAVVTCVGYHFFGPSGLLMSIFAIVLSRIVIVKKDFSSRPVSGCPDRHRRAGGVNKLSYLSHDACAPSFLFQQQILQADHLVAVLRRLDEVQPLGRLLHQPSRVGDASLQLFAAHVLHHRVGSHRLLRLHPRIRPRLPPLFPVGLPAACRLREDVCGARLVQRLRRDAVLCVVAQLLLPAAIRLVDGQAHALRHRVGIHDDAPVHVACRTPGRLGQRAVRAEESLLVRVQDGDKRHFGQVQPLAQQVDTYQDVIHPLAQVGHDFHPLQRLHITMYIVAPHVVVQQIFRQLLRHPLGQRRHQRPFPPLDTHLNLLHQVVNLVMTRPDFDDRVQQSRRADDLLHDDTLRLGQLILGRCGADIDDLPRHLLELVKLQRAVVKRRRQAETILHQVLFPRPVPAIHGPDLRHAHMALVNHRQVILRKKVQQTVRSRPRSPVVEIPRIVFYPRTMPQFAQHLHVIRHPLLQPLGLQHLPPLLEPLHLRPQIILNLMNGPQRVLLRRHEQVGRINLILIHPPHADSAHRVHLLNPVHLVTPEVHPQQRIGVSQPDIHRIPLHTETSPRQFQVVAHVQAVHQPPQEHIPAERLATPYFDDIVIKIRRIPHAVYARHRRHYHHILPPRQQRRNGRQAQFVYLIVDRQILFYIRVRRRQVSFRLVIIVIRHIILDCILREKALELAIQLGSQRLVMAQNQCRLIDIGNDVGYGKRFPRPGHSQQGLCRKPLANPVRQLGDGLGLVSGRTVT